MSYWAAIDASTSVSEARAGGVQQATLAAAPSSQRCTARALIPVAPRTLARAGGRLATESFGAIDDARSQEDHQLAAAVAGAAALEQQSNQRNVTEERDLVEVSTRVAGE